MREEGWEWCDAIPPRPSSLGIGLGWFDIVGIVVTLEVLALDADTAVVHIWYSGRQC